MSICDGNRESPTKVSENIRNWIDRCLKLITMPPSGFGRLRRLLWILGGIHDRVAFIFSSYAILIWQVCKYNYGKNAALQLFWFQQQQPPSCFAWSKYLPVYDARSEKPPILRGLFWFVSHEWRRVTGECDLWIQRLIARQRTHLRQKFRSQQKGASCSLVANLGDTCIYF